MELTKDFCSIINPTFPEGIEFLAAFPVASSKNFSNLFSGGTGGSGGGIGFGSDESPKKKTFNLSSSILISSHALPNTIFTKQYSIKAINTKTVHTDIKASTAVGKI